VANGHAVTWRDRCLTSLTHARDVASRDVPALAEGSVVITRTPSTTIRFETRHDAAHPRYEASITEPSPDSDFDTDITELPWHDVRADYGSSAPTLAMQRRHRARDASLEARDVPQKDAERFSAAFRVAGEECLVFAERASSHDYHFVGTVTAVEPFTHDVEAIVVDAAPRFVVTMRIDEADRDAPFKAGSLQRFAVREATHYDRKPKPYWLQRDLEGTSPSFALAPTVSMIDESDICPVDAGPSDADDGCPQP